MFSNKTALETNNQVEEFAPESLCCMSGCENCVLRNPAFNPAWSDDAFAALEARNAKLVADAESGVAKITPQSTALELGPHTLKESIL